MSNNTTYSFDTQPNIVTKYIDIFAVVFAIIISISGIFGNLVVIYVLKFRIPGPLSSYDTILVYLAVNDLLCAASSPIVFAYGTLTKFREWLIGEIGCKVVMAILPVNISASQGLLVLISLERYKSLTKPLLRRHIGQKGVAKGFLCILFISFLLVLPQILAFTIIADERYHTKTCTSPGNKTLYMLAYSAFNLSKDLICTLVLASTGCLISKALKQNARRQERFSQSRQKAELELSKRRSKVLRNIVIAFSFCAIPLDAFQLCFYTSFQILKNTISTNVYLWLRSTNTVLYLLQICSVVVNVFIYGRKYAPFDGLFKTASKIPNIIISKIPSRNRSVDLEAPSGDHDIATIRTIAETRA